MLCDICHKNLATIYFKGIFNKKVIKLNLCKECAEKKSMKFFLKLTDLDKLIHKEKKSIQCKNCGITYQEFKETTKLGCPNCYLSFAHYLNPLIKRIHGSNKYSGKKVSVMSAQSEQELLMQELKKLKSELDELVKNEEYERAAELRDKIKEVIIRLNETK